jgi:hypothetical protein
MKIIRNSIIAILLISFSSCHKTNEQPVVTADAIIGYSITDGCGFLIWIGSNKYKPVNESIIADSCRNRYYTDVTVQYQLLNTQVPITCKNFTPETSLAGLTIISIKGR